MPAHRTQDPLAPLLPRQPEDRRRAFRKRRQLGKVMAMEMEHKPVYDCVFRGARGKPSVKRRLAQAARRVMNGEGKDIDAPAEQRKQGHKRSLLYTVLNPNSCKIPAVAFKRFITTVILSDLFLFVLSTDPAYYQNEQFFHVSEGIASTIFMLEYLVRLWTIPEKRRYNNLSSGQARWRYAMTWPAVIDLASALPFFLEIPTGWNLPTLTYLRFLRLFRILKTESTVRALDAVYRVLYYNAEVLNVAAVLCVFLVLVTAVLLFYFRPLNDDAQDFQSIGATLYLSTMMLTGQGSPEGPLPWYTKGIVIVTSVFSVAMFAIPSSMITWGFEAEAQRMAKRARQRALSQRSAGGVMDDDDGDGFETSSEVDTTDEEYFKIIAGEDLSGDTTENESPFIKRLREAFEKADINMDGELTLQEFIEMQGSMENLSDTVLQGPTTDAMNSRLVQLENQVARNSKKLDKILELLSKDS